MVNYKYSELLKKDKAGRKLNIDFGDFAISNEDIPLEMFELLESLCSESTLRFGCCEASSLKMRINNNVIPLSGKKFTVSEKLKGGEDTPFVFGSYKVNSDKPTADKRYRDIVAYDAMHDVILADMTAWYNSILPNKDSKVTLKQFRDSFFQYLGIAQEPVTLINDDMTVEKTIDPENLKGQTVITAICEICGCFGHIGRNGKFQYVHLKEMVQGRYPANNLFPANDVFPADPLNAENISRSHYIRATYEDFTTERINKLQIRKEENDIGCIYPETAPSESDNCYIMQDNFLVYGKSAAELKVIAQKLYQVISKIWYRPAHVEAKGNPCLEVGDGIRLSTRYEIVYTYILQRTLKGIQALRDTYDAEGEQYQSDKVPSMHEQIIELKGKTNKLFRNVEETRLEIADVERGLNTKILQNAESIRLEAERATKEEGKLSASVKLTADSISAEVKRATGVEGQLSASIKVEADKVTAEVKRATEAEGTMSAQISANAQQILLKVSKNSVISEINQTAEKITISALKIDLVGLVNANEFVSKYATISALNVTNELVANKASISSLNALDAVVEGKLDADEFNANTISAMNIKVKAANVTGTLSASQIKTSDLQIGQNQITGTSNVNAVIGGKYLSFEYMKPDGTRGTVTVMTGVVTKNMKVLSVE